MEKKADPAIERYLLHAMTPDEQQQFQTRLAAEPELVAELAFYEALWLHRDQQSKNRWAAKGQQLFKSGDQTQPELTVTHSSVWQRFSQSPYRWAVAATFALLIVAAGIWVTRDPYQNLYSAYYERLPSSSQLSGYQYDGENSIPVAAKTWEQAFELYAVEKYDQALQKVAKLTPNANTYLFTGTCLLEQNRPMEAVQAFEQVDRKALSQYNRAQFYIALAYLRAHDADKARDQLTKIVNDPENQFKGKSAAMLEKLN